MKRNKTEVAPVRSIRYRDLCKTPAGRLEYCKAVFLEVASKYDFVTRALSLGADRAWKEWLVSQLPDVRDPRCLDIACGTGDICRLLAEKYPTAQITGIDIVPRMIDIARRKITRSTVDFQVGDMCNMPLSDSSVDIVTGGYAIRNAPDLDCAIREVRRVLRLGGTAAFLDFSKPVSPIIQKIQLGILRAWGSFWGLVLHGRAEVYGYIALSLNRFPNREELHSLFEIHNFQIAQTRRLYFGIVEAVLLRAI
jgi:ubiquinone/menaquinone biosynthesis methyltransferase